MQPLKNGMGNKGSKSSKGTAKTAVEGMGKGGKIRENGKMKKVPLAYKTLDVDFGYGPQNTMTIPWADVYTAYHSTGISNMNFILQDRCAQSRNFKDSDGFFRW